MNRRIKSFVEESRLGDELVKKWNERMDGEAGRERPCASGHFRDYAATDG